MAGNPVASMPMYDWPEVTHIWDGFWEQLRKALQRHGIEVPSVLSRGDPWAVWQSPNLLISQTCGWPLVRYLTDNAVVLGAFDFGLNGCGPGEYNSVIVARSGVWQDLHANGLPACNDTGSQSGYRVLAGHPHLADAQITGSHRASVKAVANGKADFAAIDAMSWRLAEAFEPAANRLEVVHKTSATPGLPLITSKGADISTLRAAIDEVFHKAGEWQEAIGLKGLVPFDLADYRAAYED